MYKGDKLAPTTLERIKANFDNVAGISKDIGEIVSTGINTVEGVIGGVTKLRGARAEQGAAAAATSAETTFHSNRAA